MKILKQIRAIFLIVTLLTQPITVSASYQSVEPTKSEAELQAEHTASVISAYKKRLEKRKQKEAEEAYLAELEAMKTSFHWEGEKLTPSKGVNPYGPSGLETFYNQDLKGIWTWFGDELNANGWYYGNIVIRNDGVRVIKNTIDDQWYVCCAADLNYRPRGTIVNTSLGKAVVLDYNGHVDLAGGTPLDIDICCYWGRVIPN